MSVKELKAFLSERGVPIVGVTEKSELVALAHKAQEQDVTKTVEALLKVSFVPDIRHDA
jgi:hypothetical protein